MDEAVEIAAQRGHEPEGDVDVHRNPVVGGVGRSGALRDVIQRLVHGEKKGDDLPPLGEVCAG